MISVIIPVYNASSFLNKLFDSLKLQTLDTDKFEILFIDNNSTDNSAINIKTFIDNNLVYNFKLYSYTKKASSYGARNYGITKASGDIFVFTDSDCILDANYLKNIYNNFESYTQKIISGAVNLIVENSRNIWENFDKQVHMRNDIRAKNSEIATANMAISRKLFEKIGCFDEVTSGGDFSFSQKAKEMRFSISFHPDILVNHPTRKSYYEIEKKMLRVAEGNGELFQGKSFIKGLILSIARFLYFPKAIKISIKMYRNVGFMSLLKFNVLYTCLRLKQIRAYVKGYRNK